MKNKRNITIPVVLMIVIISSLITSSRLENIRTVDILQLLALGALIGILIVNLRMYFRNKNQNKEE